MTTETQAVAHDPRYGRVPGRSAYLLGCRCPGCKKGNADYAKAWRAKETARRHAARPAARNGSQPDRDPFGWQREPESPPEPESAGPCPQCAEPMTATVGGTSAACPACGYWQRSADAIARLAATRPKRSQAVTAPEPSQAELDRAALDLAGRKGKLRGEVIAFRDRESKRLGPDSLEQIDHFLNWIASAQDNARIDEIIALLRTHKWNKQHWYNLKPQPEIESADEYYINEDADDDICQVYLVGENPCENPCENDSHIITDAYGNGWEVCPGHWHVLGQPEPAQARPGQSYLGAALTALNPAARLAANADGYKTGVIIPGAGKPLCPSCFAALAARGRVERQLDSKPSGECWLCRWVHGKHSDASFNVIIKPETDANRPANMLARGDWLSQNVDGWQINVNGNGSLCPVRERNTGRACAIEYSQPVTEAKIVPGTVYLCGNHAGQATARLRTEIKLRSLDFNSLWGRLGYTVDFRRTQRGHCCLGVRQPAQLGVPDTGPEWCQRPSAIALGHATICEYHSRSVMATLREMRLI